MTTEIALDSGLIEGREDEKKLKYYTASQWELVLWRFRRHKVAMAGALVLAAMLVSGIFAGFFAPYTVTQRDSDYVYGPPQLPTFWDSHGVSLQPFIHGLTTKRDPVTLRKIATVDPDTRKYVGFFVKGEPYEILGLVGWDVHLFGVDGGIVHLFGTDEFGRDVFSRTLYASATSLSIGILGVLVAFVLALIIGGVAGYFGGWIDYVIQRITEVIRVVPIIPLYMGLAAAFPREWSNTEVYFAMMLVFGLVGWPTLSRRIRSHLLSQRTEDYVLAARLAGATPFRIITKHLLPSFTSYIIVDLVISFPYMILSETALSFIGLGLRPPSVSWGILLQDAQNVRAIEQAPWLFIPALFVVVAVLSFTVLGDGLRDAADPYTVSG
ncbi:ABC transporter permease [Oceanidesulfovibrio marinus]|uniref:ABC transporter permease n=1 Tax=Oceanidesulfovibrio marinus TaxID=370038 RepID=A0A6P1ZHD8_9BACT|nr:ABC transporter permease [Oceanidesulfovibrio marinus]TVM33788.1 ABC transporter permease [Oceanidesulfovibrio marinus]